MAAAIDDLARGADPDHQSLHLRKQPPPAPAFRVEPQAGGGFPCRNGFGQRQRGSGPAGEVRPQGIACPGQILVRIAGVDHFPIQHGQQPASPVMQEVAGAIIAMHDADAFRRWRQIGAKPSKGGIDQWFRAESIGPERRFPMRQPRRSCIGRGHRGQACLGRIGGMDAAQGREELLADGGGMITIRFRFEQAGGGPARHFAHQKAGGTKAFRALITEHGLGHRHLGSGKTLDGAIFGQPVGLDQARRRVAAQHQRLAPARYACGIKAIGLPRRAAVETLQAGDADRFPPACRQEADEMFSRQGRTGP